jgi:hypothetical protein
VASVQQNPAKKSFNPGERGFFGFLFKLLFLLALRWMGRMGRKGWRD